MAALLEKRIKTNEDWYPTEKDAFGNGFVDVRICELHRFDITTEQRNFVGYRVAVWGGDDFGLEIDHLSMQEALAVYMACQDYITQDQLREIGMVNA